MSDETRRFTIGRGSVRGEHVKLTGAWQSLLARRAYPTAVRSLLGECLAASTLFTSALKLIQADGRLTLQIQGGAPVSLLIAECRADLSVRAMARLDPQTEIKAGMSLTDLTGGASFAVTIEPGGDFDSYQSLVPIESDSVASILNAYMRQSEQIESHFVLAADEGTCAGLLVQKIPQIGGKENADADPDLWNRIQTLTSTLTPAELLELSVEDALHLLFHQEEVRVLPGRPVHFVCRCSKDRVGGVLKVLGTDEVRGLLADRRTIGVDCDFCGKRYTFSAEEAWTALAD
ncbi:MAG: Hsp33 family molecular chaperone HslO [Vicinamibacteria bacterium]